MLIVISRKARSIRRRSLILVGVVLLAACGLMLPWERSKSLSGCFGVEMPGEATATEHRATSTRGQLLVHGLQVADVDQSSYLERLTAPPVFFAWATSLAGLSIEEQIAVRDEFVGSTMAEEKKMFGSIVAEKSEFTATACSGIELWFKHNYSVSRSRLCVADERLFMLLASGRERQVFGGVGDRFFNSLRVFPRSCGVS